MQRCGEVRPALGVYVLGTIEPADRGVVDFHLAECAECRRELAELAGLPALLRRVSLEELAALTAEDSRVGCAEQLPTGLVLESKLARASKRRRRSIRNRVTAATAVGLLAGAGIITGWHAVHMTTASAPSWTGMSSAASRQTGASATVRYAARRWGLQLSVQVAGIPAGTTYELKVINSQGQAVTAGSWKIAAGPANWYPASASVPLSEVRGFVLSAGSRALLTIPRTGPPASSRLPAGESR